MNTLLNDSIRQQVRDVFVNLQNPVKILFFGKTENCEACNDTRQLAEEVAELSDQITLETYDLDNDIDIAKLYKIDKTPGIVIAAVSDGQIRDYGIRLSGIPAGHEFTTLIQDIIFVSAGDSGLTETTRQFLKNIKQPLHLQVYVTPTCPYCPRAVLLAHAMAMENPLITAEMVEATEFPELASRHQVSGVPQTTINDGAGRVVGAVPEDSLVASIAQVLN